MVRLWHCFNHILIITLLFDHSLGIFDGISLDQWFTSRPIPWSFASFSAPRRKNTTKLVVLSSCRLVPETFETHLAGTNSSFFRIWNSPISQHFIVFYGHPISFLLDFSISMATTSGTPRQALAFSPVSFVPKRRSPKASVQDGNVVIDG